MLYDGNKYQISIITQKRIIMERNITEKVYCQSIKYIMTAHIVLYKRSIIFQLGIIFQISIIIQTSIMRTKGVL